MICSVLLAAVLCVVAGFEEEPKYFKVITVAKKFVDPKGSYPEEAPPGKYPMYVSQPYPIYVEKRMSYGTEQSQYGVPYDKPQNSYDKKTYPGTITPINDDDDRYGKGEVVRSPLIFAVSNKSLYKRMPYPLNVHLSDGGHSCQEESLHRPEEFYYPPRAGDKNGYRSEEIPSDVGNQKVKLVNFGGKIGIVKPNEQDSFPYEKEGEVHHREVFQTPVIIAEEKPGYRYVKHLVGAGQLPVGKQFHVVILEEEEAAESPEHRDLPEEPEKEYQEPSLKDSSHFHKKSQEGEVNSEEKKPEEDVEEKKDNHTANNNGPQSDDGRIIFPSSVQHSRKSSSGGKPKEDSKKTKVENDSEVHEAEISEIGGEIDIKMES